MNQDRIEFDRIKIECRYYGIGMYDECKLQNPRETFTSVANDSPSAVFNQTKFGPGQENPTVGLTCFNCVSVM